MSGRADEDRVTHRHHFAGLDGLRGVAAFWVVASHAMELVHWPMPAHFSLAVDFFFVLSGFVVAHAYHNRLASGRMSIATFARLRVLRLHPLVLLGIAFALAARIVQNLRGEGASLEASALAAITAAVFIPYHELSAEPAAFPLNNPQWSLLAEYAANLLYALIAGLLTGRRLVALLLLGIGLLLTTIAVQGSIETGWSLATWPWGLARVVFPFFAGVALARAHAAGRLPAWRISWWAQALVLTAILLAPASPLDPLLQLVAILFVFPAIVVAGRSNRFDGRAARWMLWTGAISYPIYILHYPVIRAIAHLGPLGARPLLAFPLQILFSLVVAQLALRLYDEPVRRWLGARLRRG